MSNLQSPGLRAVDAAEGDCAPLPTAGVDWLEELRPRLIRLAHRVLGCPHDAEEIVQETLMLAWHHRLAGRSTGQRNAWLFRTTVNLCRNRLRLKARRRPAPGRSEEAIASDGPESYTDETLTGRLREVLSELPPGQHAAVVLREMEGLSYEEVGAILGKRQAAVRVLVHRGRERMRKLLLKRWPDAFGTQA